MTGTKHGVVAMAAAAGLLLAAGARAQSNGPGGQGGPSSPGGPGGAAVGGPGASSGTGGGESGAPASDVPEARSAQGAVKSVDPSTGAMTLEDGKRLQLGPSTDVVRAGQGASMSDIQEGDQVRASYERGTDKIQYVEVTPRGSGSSAPSGATGTGSGQ